MDNSKVIGAILLDLRKAFDLVNHDIFFCQTKLSAYFTSEHTMQWFKSYLSDRSQTCIILGKTSVPLPLVLGIPLGSIWGPLFFQFASMICHFLYKILKLICMQMTLPSGYYSDHVWNYMYTTVITRKSWQCKLLVQP